MFRTATLRSQFHFPVLQSGLGDLLGTKLALRLNTTEINLREIAANRVSGGLSGGMSDVEEAAFEEQTASVASCDADDPSLLRFHSRCPESNDGIVLDPAANRSQDIPYESRELRCEQRLLIQSSRPAVKTIQKIIATEVIAAPGRVRTRPKPTSPPSPRSPRYAAAQVRRRGRRASAGSSCRPIRPRRGSSRPFA